MIKSACLYSQNQPSCHCEPKSWAKQSPWIK